MSWPFLPLPQNGRLTFPTLERSVRDAIRIILTTRPGEQLMRPRFGAGLQSFLDEGNSLTLRRQIQTAILEGLQN
ncbi:MAG: GPW/gp25 family protein, partial [Candidatus Tumulicola sp.]